MTFHPLRSCADLFRLVQCVPDFRQYRQLQAQFGFDPWHVKSPYRRRPYKRRVVAMINGFKPQSVVEIGCGLGEIVSRVMAERRFGFDLETAVIDAAKALHGDGVSFRQGDLRKPEDIAAAVGGPIDVLVAVNWPHMLPFDEIETAINGLAEYVPVRRLVIDTIYPNRHGYQHYHTRRDVERLGEVIATVPGGDFIRDLHAVTLRA
jgi:SAM-dependent methyltransferase